MRKRDLLAIAQHPLVADHPTNPTIAQDITSLAYGLDYHQPDQCDYVVLCEAARLRWGGEPAIACLLIALVYSQP